MRRCWPAWATRSPTPSRGWMMRGGNASASCKRRLLGFARLEPVGVFERRCRLLARRWPVTKASPNWTVESRRCRCDVGSTSVRDAPHPPRPGPRTRRRVVVGDRRPTATLKRATGTRAPRSTSCSPTPSSSPSGANVGGAAGAGDRGHIQYGTMLNGSADSVCGTAMRSRHRRSGVWPVTPRSCRSCSTAPAKPWTVAANTVRTVSSGGRYGRMTAAAATPAATSRSPSATSTTPSTGATSETPNPTILPLLCWHHHHCLHEQHFSLEPLGAGHFHLHHQTAPPTRRGRPASPSSTRTTGHLGTPSTHVDARPPRRRRGRGQASAWSARCRASCSPGHWCGPRPK